MGCPLLVVHIEKENVRTLVFHLLIYLNGEWELKLPFFNFSVISQRTCEED